MKYISVLSTKMNGGPDGVKAGRWRLLGNRPDPVLYGHIFDEGQLDRLEEIFTPEVVYDLRAAGVGTLDGCRISHRVIRPQRTPMNGAYIAGEAGGQS
jgi:hypothetical protein